MMSTHRLLLLLTVTSVAVVATNECQGIKRDLIILLDSSSSVGQENFDKAKEFLVAIISELVIGVEGYQIGLVKFSDSVFPVADLVQYKDKAGLIGAIRAIDYKGGGTNTARALWGAMKLFGRSGNRGAVPDQIITLTDGASDNAASTASEIEAARAKKIEMISIGVGSDINREELRSLATNESLMYVVDSYDDMDSIKTQLIASSCGVTTTTTTTTTTTVPTTTTTSTTTTTTTTTTSPSPSPTTITTTSSSTSTATATLKPPTTVLDEFSLTINSTASAKRPSASSIDASSGVTSDDDPTSSGQDAADSQYESVLSSAVGKWKKIAGITIAAFACVALVTGLVYAVVLRYRNKQKKRFLETL